jgi:hypothetical protein
MKVFDPKTKLPPTTSTIKIKPKIPKSESRQNQESSQSLQQNLDKDPHSISRILESLNDKLYSSKRDHFLEVSESLAVRLMDKELHEDVKKALTLLSINLSSIFYQ